MKKIIKEILYAAHECGVCGDWSDKICEDVLDILNRDEILKINEEDLDDLAYDYNEERQPHYWWEDDGTVCVCESSEVRKAFEAGYKAAKKGE